MLKLCDGKSAVQFTLGPYQSSAGYFHLPWEAFLSLTEVYIILVR